MSAPLSLLPVCSELVPHLGWPEQAFVPPLLGAGSGYVVQTNPSVLIQSCQVRGSQSNVGHEGYVRELVV